MVLLVFGAALVVAGVACWSVAAALVCGGLLTMVGAVALAAAQNATPPRSHAPVGSPNGVIPEREAAVG